MFRFFTALFIMAPIIVCVPLSVAAQGTQKFKNPLSFTRIEDLLGAILNVAIVLALPIVAFFIIYGGFLYVTARGNPEQIQQAGRSLLYGVIGGVIIVGSVAILEIIRAIVGNF